MNNIVVLKDKTGFNVENQDQTKFMRTEQHNSDNYQTAIEF